MPLPKDLAAKLKGMLKEGESLPVELDELVVFPDSGAFNAEVERKTKSKLGDADKKALQAAKDAREATAKEIADRLGIEDPEKIDEIRDRLAAADGNVTELEKVKGELTKVQKELKKAVEQNAELGGFKTTVLKEKALAPHLAKVGVDFRDMVTENLLGKLTIDGDKITAPGGVGIDAYIDDLIKAKPSLKAPDYKPGAGTGPGGGKKPEAQPGDGGDGGNGNGAGDGDGNGARGKQPQTFREAWRQKVVQPIIDRQATGGQGPTGP